MSIDLAHFLQQRQPIATETAVWGWMQLHIQTYLSDQPPPLDVVTSVRAVLFRQQEVLVVQEENDSYHIVPGGRREPDETIAETLRRELLEETGWSIQQPRLFAFVHFHHLTPRPPNHRYPYPDFVQLVFIAQAHEHHPAAMLPAAQLAHEFVHDVQFMPVAAAAQLPMGESQRRLLQAAMRLQQV